MAKKSYQIAFEIGGKLNASLPKSIFTAAGQLDKLGKQIVALEKAQGVSTRFRSLHNEIDSTKLKLRQAEAEMKKLDVEMRATASPTKEMAQNFAAAKLKVEGLRGQLKGQIVELREVKTAMAAAGISARSFAEDNAKLAASLAKAKLAQQRVRENLGARAANKEKMAQARASLGTATSATLGAAAGVAAWVLPVKVAADFEDSMVRAGALARATDGQLAELTATARKLGRDTRFSATAAAEGMQYLAQSGFKTNEIIQAMPGMLDIAAAGAVDLGTASDITANILRGFGMQAGESARLGDVLTNTFTNSSTNLTMLGDTMKYVGPIAKATGVSLEQTAAAAGLLGNAGIKGEQAGTALRAMLTRLVAPARKGREVLAKLGVKTKDTHGNMLPLADILSQMSRKLSKFGNATRQAMTAHVFGLEAATAATVLIGEAGSGNLQKFTTAVKKSGTAAEIAAKQNATMKGQWDNLKGSVEDAGIQIGTTLMPVLKRLIDQVVPVINSVTKWAQENPKLTESIVLGAAALSILTLGLTLSAVGFNGARVAIIAAHGAMLLMNAVTLKAAAAWAVSQGPVLLLAAGIAGLAYASKNLMDNWNVVKQWWDELWDGMLDKVASVWNAIPKSVRWLISQKSGGIFGYEDIARGKVASNFGPRGNLATFLAQDKAARDAKINEFTNPTVDEPTWLKSKYETPSWLQKANKLGADGGGNKSPNISFSPQITVAPGGAKDARAELDKGMDAAKREFEKMMKGFMAQERRTASE